MKNKTKVLGILAASTVMSAALAVALPNVGTSAADGETPAATFTFTDGASVRLNDDGNGGGIRFRSEITGQYIQNLRDENGTKAITLKSEITDANGATTVSKEWALNEEGTTVDVNETYTYYHAIEYTSLSAANLKKAAGVELTAKMWIEVANDSGEPTVIKAATEQTSREARVVAQYAYNLPKYAASREELDDYFTSSTTVSEPIFYETNTLTLPTKYEGCTFYEGTAKLGDSSAVTATTFDKLGEKKTLTLFDDDDNAYNVPVMYVTKALTKASDLSMFDLSDYNVATETENKYIEGYYVLANDIDYADDDAYTPLANDTWKSGTASKGFAGTFDGLGHSMKVKVGESGIFGAATSGTVVKNVAIETEYSENQSVVFWESDTSTESAPSLIENVYVKIGDYADKIINASVPVRPTTLFLGQYSYTSMRQVVVEVDAPYAYTLEQAQNGSAINGTTTYYNYGVIAKYSSYIGETYEDYFAYATCGYQDVYVVTGTSTVGGVEVDNEMPLISYADNTTTPTYALYALNDSPDGEPVTNATKKVHTNTTDSIKRYGTYAAMKADKENDYSGFNEYWNTTEFGFPIFKGTQDVVATVDGEATTTVVLNKADKTSADVSLSVLGESLSFTLSTEADEVSVNGKTITAVAITESPVTVTATYSLDGETKTVDFSVSVEKAITEITAPIALFSAMDGDGKGTDTLASVLAANGVTGEIVSARDVDGNELTFDNAAKTLSGVATNRDGVTDVTVVLFTDTLGYQLTLEAYTKVITTATEMKTFDSAEHKTTLDGYFVLGNDIDYTTETDTYKYNTNSISDKTICFAGVFDGLGHSMKVQIGEYGIFGLATNNTVVKNVAIETNSPGNRSAVFWYGTNCGSTTPSRIENVYVKISDYAEKITSAASNARPTTLFASQWAYTSMRQVIVEVDAPNAYTLEQAQSGSAINGEKTFYNYGIIALTTSYAADYAVNKVVQKYSYENGEYKLDNESGTYTQRKYTDYFKHATYGYQDVYVVTGTSTVGGVEVDNEMPLISFANNTTTPTYAIYAFNDAEEAITSIYYETAPKTFVFTNTTNSIKRYGTYKTMKEDTNNDYSNFNSYWDTTNGYPVFKSANA